MPERLVDAIDELAQPNRPQQEEPQIQADPALRRPRLLRNAHAAVVAVIVAGTAAAAGWATFWALGMPAVSDRLGPMSEHLAIRLAAAVLVGVVAGGLVARVFRPVQTLRGAVRSWLIASRRRTARIPLFASVAAAVLIGLVLSGLLTRAIGGVFVMDTTPATAVDVVKAALPPRGHRGSGRTRRGVSTPKRFGRSAPRPPHSTAPTSNPRTSRSATPSSNPTPPSPGRSSGPGTSFDGATFSGGQRARLPAVAKTPPAASIILDQRIR